MFACKLSCLPSVLLEVGPLLRPGRRAQDWMHAAASSPRSRAGESLCERLLPRRGGRGWRAGERGELRTALPLLLAKMVARISTDTDTHTGHS